MGQLCLAISLMNYFILLNLQIPTNKAVKVKMSVKLLRAQINTKLNFKFTCCQVSIYVPEVLRLKVRFKTF